MFTPNAYALMVVVKTANIVVDFGGAPTAAQYLDVLLYLTR